MVDVAAIKPVKTARTGATKTYIAASRIPFGAAVVRSAAGTIKIADTADANPIGFALEDESEHLYDGFYEAYEPVPVALEGTVNALVAFITDADMVEGDFLEVGDFSSGGTDGAGVLAEAGAAAGETKTTTTTGQALEAGDFGAAFYQIPASNVAVGATTITMSAGVVASMGLSIGDFILMADIDGGLQPNRIVDLTATVITLEIPALVALTTANNDLVYRIWQKEIQIIK